MIRLEYSIVWGSILAEIKALLDLTEELYLGLLINSLRYKSEVEGREEKKKYLLSLRNQTEKINKQVKGFNVIRRHAFGEKSKITKLTPINFSHLRRIVLNHKGDYPEEKGLKNFVNELLGNTDSASSLARKHTALLLRNALMPLRIELNRFIESLRLFEEPYQEYLEKKKKVRIIVSREIEKSIVCYSVNLNGEALFIIGRLLENLSTEWLIQLKRQGAIQLQNAKIEELDFDQKLNRLCHVHKKITHGQFSKAMSLKWDRNIFGHKIRKLNDLNKDSGSNIRIGVGLVMLFESKIKKKTTLKNARRSVKS